MQKSERAHAAAPPVQIEPAALGFDLVSGAALQSVLLFKQQDTLWDILIFIVCDPKLNAAEISFDMPVSWYIIYNRFLFVFKSPSFFKKGMKHLCLHYC